MPGDGGRLIFDPPSYDRARGVILDYECYTEVDIKSLGITLFWRIKGVSKEVKNDKK